jgi:tetratricopeptide (TPR) repeat protein
VSADRVRELRGEGRWNEALELIDDPLARADLMNEWALFAGDAEARAEAVRELDRAEARLALERGRILHARFLAERGAEDPRELEVFECALELFRRADDRAGEGEALFWIGLVYQVVRGNPAAAEPFFADSYELAREHGDAKLMSYAARHLGFVDYEAGRLDEAEERFRESVDLRERERFWPGVAAGLVTLAEVAAERGRRAEAKEHLQRARELAERTGAHAFLRRIEAAGAEHDL